MKNIKKFASLRVLYIEVKFLIGDAAGRNEEKVDIATSFLCLSFCAYLTETLRSYIKYHSNSNVCNSYSDLTNDKKLLLCTCDENFR